MPKLLTTNYCVLFTRKARFIEHNPPQPVVARFIEHNPPQPVVARFIGHHGFSLIEILVALVILSIVLLPFLSTISYRLSKERENDEIIRAIEIAKSKMEEVLLLPEIKDNEEIIENKYLLKIKVLDGDKYDEPPDLRPTEIRISVLRLRDKVRLIKLCTLK